MRLYGAIGMLNLIGLDREMVHSWRKSLGQALDDTIFGRLIATR